MQIIQETRRAHLIWYLRFYYTALSQGNTAADGLLVSEGIIRPVVSASAPTWLVRYIYYWNFQFLNNVIINKTKVLLSQQYETLVEFGYPV